MQKTDDEILASAILTGRRLQLTSLINPNQNRPNLNYEFRGVSAECGDGHTERMQEAYARGSGLFRQLQAGFHDYKRYLDEHEGETVRRSCGLISPPINSQAQERLGYPTQKPQASVGANHQRERAIPATLSSTRFAAAAPLSTRHRSSVGNGSASTSPISQST